MRGVKGNVREYLADGGRFGRLVEPLVRGDGGGFGAQSDR